MTTAKTTVKTAPSKLSDYPPQNVEQLLSVNEFCALKRMSRTKAYSDMASGALTFETWGGRRKLRADQSPQG